MGNGWDDERSFLDTHLKTNPVAASGEAATGLNRVSGDMDCVENLLKVKGSYYHNDVEFCFSGVQQTAGKYLFRGSVSVVSPENGKILKLKHPKKKEGNSSQDLFPSETGEGQNHATDALSSEITTA